MLLLFDLKEVEMLDFTPGQIYENSMGQLHYPDYMDPHTRSLKETVITNFLRGKITLSTDDILKQVRFKLEICDGDRF